MLNEDNIARVSNYEKALLVATVEGSADGINLLVKNGLDLMMGNDFQVVNDVEVVENIPKRTPSRVVVDTRKKTGNVFVMGGGGTDLAILVNSPGGWVFNFPIFKVLADDIRAQDGKVMTFCRESAQSLAAMLFTLGDDEKRFMDSKARLMFHKSHFSGKNTPDEEERPKLTETLLRATVGSRRREMRRKIDVVFKDPNNQDREINFTAQEAARFGIGKVGDVNESLFRRVCGLRPDVLLPRRVERFFQAGIAKKLLPPFSFILSAQQPQV